MTENSIIYEKSKDFAVRVVKLWKYLCNKGEQDISRQLKRSGTGIGANIIEGLYGASKKDFINKLCIAQKECNESLYWIDILHKTDFITDAEYNSIHNDGEEIARILAKIIKTSRKNVEVENTTHNL
jgi:four helix bundle protein